MGKKLKEFSPIKVVNDKVSGGEPIAQREPQHTEKSKETQKKRQGTNPLSIDENTKLKKENEEGCVKEIELTLPKKLLSSSVELNKKLGSKSLSIEKNLQQKINYEELFIFARKGKQFAVPLHNVIEVVRDFGSIGEIPLRVHSCTGSINYKSKLIPVFETFFLSNNPLDVEDDKLPKEKKLSLLRVLIDELEVSFTMDRHVDVVSDKKSITNSMMDDFVPSTNTTYIKQTMGYRNSSVSIIFLEKIWFDLNNSVSRQNVIDPVGEHSDTEDDTIKASYREYIYAQIYDYHFIVDIENVLEIIEGYDVTRIHDSKNFVRGLINLRGQVIGCVDISSELGREKLIIDERNKYIVLNHDIYDFALCVSDVIGIRSYSPASFIPAVNVLSEEMSSLFSGVSEQESNTLLILSTDSIINSPKLANYKVGAHG